LSTSVTLPCALFTPILRDHPLFPTRRSSDLYRFVEFALGLSTFVKLNQGWTKWPLRAAMQNVLPSTICWRKDKIGFAAPDRLWLDRKSTRLNSSHQISPYAVFFLKHKKMP